VKLALKETISKEEMKELQTKIKYANSDKVELECCFYHEEMMGGLEDCVCNENSIQVKAIEIENIKGINKADMIKLFNDLKKESKKAVKRDNGWFTLELRLEDEQYIIAQYSI